MPAEYNEASLSNPVLARLWAALDAGQAVGFVYSNINSPGLTVCWETAYQPACVITDMFRADATRHPTRPPSQTRHPDLNQRPPAGTLPPDFNTREGS